MRTARSMLMSKLNIINNFGMMFVKDGDDDDNDDCGADGAVRLILFRWSVELTSSSRQLRSTKTETLTVLK